MNERGQELSTSTIILIILGVIILVVLVIGFTIGWNKIIPYVSQSNVNTLSTQCLAACSTNSVYDFCSKTLTLSSGTTTLTNVTCNYLSQPSQSQYGISACSSIPCSNVQFIENTNNQLTTSNFNSQTICTNPSYSGKIIQTLISNTLYSVQC
jgi:hypothetical protein